MEIDEYNKNRWKRWKLIEIDENILK